jgi:hypothetical protein
VKGLVKLEKLAMLDLEADTMTAQFENNDIVGMRRSIGKLVKFAGKKPVCKATRVLNDSGLLTQTYEEERYAFREYFMKLMSGTLSQFSDVVERDRHIDCNRYDGVDIDTCWQSIPSPTDVMGMKLLANANKATGENLIVGKVDKVFTHSMLKAYYPLILKTYVRIQPPLQWKGGMLHEIFKNKGMHCLRSGFRDVLLANDSGKQVCKYLRTKLVPRARKLVYPTQFGGGFNGGETAFAHLYIRMCT